jgi:hypothetical protein
VLAQSGHLAKCHFCRVPEAVFNAEIAYARRADGEARADRRHGRIECFLLPCGAWLLLRLLQGKQSGTDASFAPAAWLMRRPAPGGSGEADSDFTLTLEQGAEDGQPQ